MTSKKIIIILVPALILLSVLILGLVRYLDTSRDILIDDAKIATGVNSQMLPIKVTSLFPKNTEKVSAWISWRNAKINIQILVKWHYITDDIPIYSYPMTIPKKEGVANVVLAMPKGKSLPSGLYKVDILLGKKRLIKTLTFEIE
ncbi:MAG: hypothetical protein NT079_02125 [Candidatus Omnitrophica bacterium]|nr:hypothetical protein [Candidatus Omnitrophota bacterium]